MVTEIVETGDLERIHQFHGLNAYLDWLRQSTGSERIDRVQLGVRMEKRMVQVLKGLAEFYGVSLGQLLENIVLHSFEAMPGEESEWSASPHGTRALEAIAGLKRVYGMGESSH